MPGIFPDTATSGVVIRNANGVCLDPPNVMNAYCPPAEFQTSCEITAIPSDCTARIVPSQINAFQSEMLCLAATMSPAGPWNCESLCNLAAAFEAWATGNKVVDGVTITGAGTAADPWKAEDHALSGQGVVWQNNASDVAPAFPTSLAFETINIPNSSDFPIQVVAVLIVGGEINANAGQGGSVTGVLYEGPSFADPILAVTGSAGMTLKPGSGGMVTHQSASAAVTFIVPPGGRDMLLDLSSGPGTFGGTGTGAILSGANVTLTWHGASASNLN